jgi:2-dehydro-3-deoxyphosphooctonate aldolase (KDO 8-P synthase)
MIREAQIDSLIVGARAPLALIAGPCVLESRELAFLVAKQVREITQDLEIPYVFKASFDKANRTSLDGYRGPGLDEGLKLLDDIRREFDVPVCTDFHTADQAASVAEVVDLLQIPAFLCRQTDMILAAAATGKATSVKKGQFLSPWDMAAVAEKFSAGGNPNLLLVERGTSFGYNNLVLDPRSLVVLRELGHPVVLDATHSVQLPGALGGSSGGQRKFIPPLMRAGAAVGVDAIFMEVHPDPAAARSDAASMWPLDRLREVLEPVIRIDRESGRRD